MPFAHWPNVTARVGAYLTYLVLPRMHTFRVDSYTDVRQPFASAGLLRLSE